MKPFLQAVAEKFYEKEGVGISDLCFVFPNRRSSLFFQRYLGKAAGKPIFSPRLITINDLFVELSGYKPVDKIEALYIIYQHYVDLMDWEDGNRESFDEFVYWGDILLSDFDDIDKYMVSAERLFTNVKDIQELDFGFDFLSENQIEAIKLFWSNFLSGADEPSKDGSIDKRKSFKKVWTILYQLYCDFKKDLASRGVAYEGMIYRSIADKISSGDGEQLIKKLSSQYHQIVFVGQNALTKCEKVLCKALMKEDLADFYWDYYGEKVTDTDNKSSLFMKDNVIDFPSKYPLDLDDVTNEKEPEYELISVPSAVGQTSVVSTILTQLSNSVDFIPEETAIVLPDETLLDPILNAIPQSICSVNVTMGMPLSGSNADTFMQLLERLQMGKRTSDQNTFFYYKNVLDILEHPIFAKCVDDEKIKEIKKEIVDGNVIFPAADTLMKSGDIFRLIFKPVTVVEEVPEYQTEIIDAIHSFIGEIDREYLYQYRCSVIRLADLHIPMEMATYFKLLEQLIGVISIPFRGEPLKGLQIMGPLETRALDFKRMIILSVNDGVFPKKSISSSFIPYNLRVGFGLPTYEFQDSISAYHFYRSIYRCEKVVMLYDSRSEGLNSGEISRFVKQLQYHYQVPITKEIVSYKISDQCESYKIGEVVKDNNVMAELKEVFFNDVKPGRFSASSLNCYLDCPMKYYFQYVKGIKEEDEVKEDIDSGLFGTIFHKVLETLYKGFEKHVVNKDDIEKLLADKKHLLKLIDDAFKEDGNIRFITGKNLIARQLILRYVQQTLNIDKQIAPFTYVKGEMSKGIDIKVDAFEKSVRLYGKIDRVDSKEAGTVRVVDYKTGRTDGKIKNDDIAALFARGDKRPSISLQLYIYSLLLKSDTNLFGSSKIQTCIYSLKSLFQQSPTVYDMDDEQVELFREKVTDLINEVFNPEIPFIATPCETACRYCNFISICKQNSL